MARPPASPPPPTRPPDNRPPTKPPDRPPEKPKGAAMTPAVAGRAIGARDVDSHIQSIVDRAPRLTDEQRNRLAALLCPEQQAAA